MIFFTITTLKGDVGSFLVCQHSFAIFFLGETQICPVSAHLFHQPSPVGPNSKTAGDTTWLNNNIVVLFVTNKNLVTLGGGGGEFVHPIKVT